MKGKHVEMIRNGPVLEIVLDRPKANAINTDVSRELGEAFFMFRDDPSLRAAILTGAGNHFFSAGWDLKAGEAVDADHGPGGFAGLTEIFDLHKPVIAAVNGMAVGGGLELALACDLIIATEQAEFFLPEVNIGIIPDSGGILRLPKVLPRAIALEMLYTGRRLTAERAYHHGLVNYVVKESRLMEKARQVADEIAKAAPLAISAVKEVLRHTEHVPVEEGYEIMRSGQLPIYRQMLQSEDVKEGQKSFEEKRNPVWSGK